MLVWQRLVVALGVLCTCTWLFQMSLTSTAAGGGVGVGVGGAAGITAGRPNIIRKEIPTPITTFAPEHKILSLLSSARSRVDTLPPAPTPSQRPEQVPLPPAPAPPTTKPNLPALPPIEDDKLAPGHVHHSTHVDEMHDGDVDFTGAAQKCRKLVSQFGVVIGRGQTPTTLGSMTQTAREDWDRLLCEHRVVPADNRIDPFVCAVIGRQYDVRPGVTWGRLDPNIALQKRWTALSCDELYRSIKETEQAFTESELEEHYTNAKKLAAEHHELAAAGAPLPARTNSAHHKLSANEEAEAKALGKQHLKRYKETLSRHSQIELCRVWKKRYGVVPAQHFGSMPEQWRDVWSGLQCDDCHLYYRIDDGPTKYVRTGNEPKIAICTGTTTRGISDLANYHFDDLALFSTLTRSLNFTAERGFDYYLYIAYDEGDRFYDQPGQEKKAEAWYNENVGRFLAERGIVTKFRLVKFVNTLKKPGPAFNHVLKIAYDDGADWFYRVNDDTELCGAWTSPFIEKLTALGPPYGAVGPICGQGNMAIMTHDFTHRMHMDIFDPLYYPAALVDWWMDDWISKVYGRKRSWQMPAVTVTHHTGKHGRRYDVDKANEQKLKPELTGGKQKILDFMRARPKQFSEEVIRTFDGDAFDGMSFGPEPAEFVW